MEKIVLSTAYLPTIEYFAFIAKSEVFFLEGCETFQKQSYRNRAYILTAGGVQSLILPTHHNTQRCCIRDVRIDYKDHWQLKHWRAIETAYSGTPYFLYYKDFLYPFFEKKYDFLFDYNTELTMALLKLLKIKKVPAITETYINMYEDALDINMYEDALDLRSAIHPKRERVVESLAYPQIFSDRQPFTDRLSVIDLLFNLGPEAVQHLNQLKVLH